MPLKKAKSGEILETAEMREKAEGKPSRLSKIFKRKEVPSSNNQVYEPQNINDNRVSNQYSNPDGYVPTDTPRVSQQHPPDSAYASSEHDPSNASGTGTSNSNLVPVENTGQIQGVGAERNLTMNKATGDVMDDDTGEVVSTVTTTTTTTTTTTSRAGGNRPQKVQIATNPGAVNTGSSAPETMVDGYSEMPADSVRPSATDNTNYNNTPQQQQPPPSNPLSGSRGRDSVPTIPGRSPNRLSREMLHERSGSAVNDPVSPMAAGGASNNFSYPRRDGAASPTFGDDTSLRTQPSLAENIKAAAVGIHGVGETLRGTLNHEIDHRLPRRDPNKASAANMKNQAVLENGRREMGGVRQY